MAKTNPFAKNAAAKGEMPMKGKMPMMKGKGKPSQKPNPFAPKGGKGMVAKPGARPPAGKKG